MMRKDESGGRLANAVHGLRKHDPGPEYVIGLAEDFRRHYGREGLVALYGRFGQGYETFDGLMRRVLWRALSRSCGDGLVVEQGVGFKHPETFEIGRGVFIAAHSFIRGRFDGRCRIGDCVWIGPQSYFDARDLVLEDYVGWWPGAKVLGSVHTGIPADVPIIQTDLEIKPVHVKEWADIGTNAVLLPGVTIGRGAIVGASAVVTHDVPAFAKVAGVQVIGWRNDANLGASDEEREETCG